MVAPDPVAFSIFGFDVMWYGVLIGIGIILEYHGWRRDAL